MAQLVIPDLADAAEARLRARSSRHGRSLEAEARAILEDVAGAAGFAEERAPPLGAEEKPLGDLMFERFKDRGLTDDEFVRFSGGIFEINDRSAMRIPDFAAGEFEETLPK